jgi:cell division protein FtsZ
VNPLFDFTIEKAKRILFNIKGNDLTMSEVNEAANVIKQVADPEAQIIFGFGADPELNSVMKITLVATEFSEGKAKILVNRDELFELAGDGRRYSFLNRLK